MIVRALTGTGCRKPSRLLPSMSQPYGLPSGTPAPPLAGRQLNKLSDVPARPYLGMNNHAVC